ncbi:MAG: CotH kinase family protein [Anaerolineae bacterium]|nr:CotH kinase family protein [Anaerolineae bacterium]
MKVTVTSRNDHHLERQLAVCLSILLLALCAALGVASSPARAQSSPPVVINEIQYHPRSGNHGEEYVELYNVSSLTVDLSGWRFNDGIYYTFPPSTILQPGGYIVVASSPAAVEAVYGISGVKGPFSGRLDNGGERVALVDATGRLMDEVTYDDHRPWPEPPDGKGPSLELINPLFNNDSPCSWAASLSLGTPGARNSVYSTGNIPPCVTDVAHAPVFPTSAQPVTVTALVADNGSVASVVLYYRPEGSSYRTLTMVDNGSGGDRQAGDRLYTALIPPQADGKYVEFYITATDNEGLQRTVPDGAPGTTSTETGRPLTISYLYLVENVPRTDPLPVYRLIMTAQNWAELTNRDLFSNILLDATFVYSREVFYNVGVRYRGENSRNVWPRPYRIKFRDEHEFEDRERLNLVSDRLGQEALSHDLFRRAGLPAPRTRFVALFINSNKQGDYLDVEEVDNDFLEAHFPDNDTGNLYRARDGGDLSYRGPDPNSYRSYYLKENNEAADDYSDIIELTNVLSNSPDEGYPAATDAVADMRQWLRWFAVQAVLDNHEGALWVGQGDDYFLYHRPSDGRFLLISWDHDTTFTNPSHSIWEPNWYARTVVRRILNYPLFTRWYYQNIHSLLENEFSVAQMYPRIDALPPVVGESTRNALKDYVARRKPAVLSEIPATRLSITTNGGADFPTSRSGVTLEGECSPLRDVYVNGDSARVQYPTPTTWRYTASLWTRDNVFVITDGLDSRVITVYWNFFSGGTLTRSLTLPASRIPYVISNDIVVPAGVTLRIEPGTTLQFEADRAVRVEGGRLLAEGTAARPIIFTRRGSGYWGGILFLNSQEDNRIVHAIVEYTREVILNPRSHGISLYGSRATIADSIIRHTQASVAVQAYPWGGRDPVLYLLRNEIYGIQSDAVHPTGGFAFIQGNHIHDVRYGVYQMEGIELSDMVTPAVVMDNHIHDVSDDCLDLNHSSALIARNVFHGCGDKGISVGHYPSVVTVTNNLIYDCRGRDDDPFSGSGIAVKDGAVAFITNNTIAGCRHGIYLYEGHQGEGGGIATVKNTIVWGNRVGLELDSRSVVTVTYSDIQTSGGAWPGEGNINADPLFRAPQAGDYRLRGDSPCVDTGTSVGAPSDDILGVYRPHGRRHDMGAYEFPVFAITTNGGRDFATSEQRVVLEGTCLPTHTVQVNGSAEGVYYPAFTRWGYTATLTARDNLFVVTAGTEVRTITIYWDRFHGGVLTENTTIPGSAYPYVITDDIFVPAGITLTIEPGATLAFQPGRRAIVEGRLVAVGTPARPITFTGETGGLWGGIVFRNSLEPSILKYTVVEHASSEAISLRPAIAALNASLQIERSTIRYGEGVGLLLQDSTVHLAGNTVHDVLTTGVSSAGGTVAVLENRIHRVTGSPGNGIVLDATARPALVSRNLIYDVAGSCLAVGRSEARVERNILRRCGGDGLSVGPTALVTATNNLIHSSPSGAGVAARDGSTVHIVHNTIVSNSYGIRLYGSDSSTVTVLNSILWGNLETLQREIPSVLIITYSDLSMEGTAQWGEGNINEYPRFRAPERDDYRLHEDSPCIDRGTPVGAASEDIQGIYRPHGEGYDMGAYEFFEYFSTYLPLVMRVHRGGE